MARTLLNVTARVVLGHNRINDAPKDELALTKPNVFGCDDTIEGWRVISQPMMKRKRVRKPNFVDAPLKHSNFRKLSSLEIQEVLILLLRLLSWNVVQTQSRFPATEAQISYNRLIVDLTLHRRAPYPCLRMRLTTTITRTYFQQPGRHTTPLL